ncbi:MmgE/PrpD family protein [Rhodococcus opacus]|uniref:MmgE/PrpD family protein n=1 Tax=Rhodococcus opacus (strain B4) TaxID=632772 RepID=C1B6S5_RHOOB|nr:MmgE/PrpD family protein [Rhodococcus opacus]BAH51378.1 hypothetical protein ROP_31310 [Rhodococcus opacus B4]
MIPPVTRQIAEFVAAAPTHPLHADAARMAVRAFVDTVGVAVAGAHEPVVSAAQSVMVPEGGSSHRAATLLTNGERVSAAHAALINGTAGHALDFDDHLSDVNGHPSVVLVPAILASGEENGLSGSAMLEAYVVGHQVMCAVSEALPVRPHWAHGWHATETVGVLGVAAAVARLEGLTIREIQSALGIAASMAAGSRQNCGFSVKPVHAGMAAMNGLLAARFAAAGIDADPDQLEAPIGFFHLFGDDSDLSKVESVLGERWTVTTRGLNVKRYPACYAVHPAGDAAVDLAKAGLNTRDVAAIKVTVQPTGLTGPIHHRPTTGNQAKFSMEYTVAAALVDGRLGLDTFTDTHVIDEKIQHLVPLVDTCESTTPPVGPGEYEKWYATVQITTKNGEKMQARGDMPHGYTLDPLTDRELDDKFGECMTVPGVVWDGTELLARLRNLEHCTNVREVLAESIRTHYFPSSPTELESASTAL